jgi:hypothetical protein
LTSSFARKIRKNNAQFLINGTSLKEQLENMNWTKRTAPPSVGRLTLQEVQSFPGETVNFGLTLLYISQRPIWSSSERGGGAGPEPNGPSWLTWMCPR